MDLFVSAQRQKINSEGISFDYKFDADKKQKVFINSDSKNIRLIAPAGAGKTQTIINRVLSKVSKGASICEFLILIFDNAAKTSLLEKFQKGSGKIANWSMGNNALDVSTLNSFGFRIFKDYLMHNNDNTITLCSPKDQFEAIKRSKKVFLEGRIDNRIRPIFDSRRIPLKVYRDLISGFKNYTISSKKIDYREVFDFFNGSRFFEPWSNEIKEMGYNEEIEKKLYEDTVKGLLYIYQKYDSILSETNHIDFDDQKLKPYLYLRSNSTTINSVMGKYKEIIVDEFQDINKLDFELIKLLGNGKRLIIVGDDDQAIYGFRGCSPKYIMNIGDLLNEEVETITLDVNYRCPKNIVEISERLIKQNRDRIHKEISPKWDYNANIEPWNAVNSGGEAQIIARMIKRLKDEQAIEKYSDIAVLYRMNSQCLPLQIAFCLEEIPFYCREQDNIIITSAMEDLLAIIDLHLKLKKNPSFVDKKATRSILRGYFRYIKDDSINRIHSHIDSSIGYQDIVNNFYKFENILGNIRDLKNVGGLRSAVESLFENYSSVEKCISEIYSNFENLGALYGGIEEALNNSLPLGEFVDIASRFKGNIDQFYDLLIELRDRIKQGLYKKDEEGDAVSLITYFKAKGRQWNTVFLPGTNQRIIPDTRSNIEDERRLFYVAVTRVTKNLYISYVRNAVGKNIDPSQFIFELGIEQGKDKRHTGIDALK